MLRMGKVHRTEFLAHELNAYLFGQTVRDRPKLGRVSHLNGWLNALSGRRRNRGLQGLGRSCVGCRVGLGGLIFVRRRQQDSRSRKRCFRCIG